MAKKMWYSWFLFFTEAVFYKLASNPELVNTELLQLGQFRNRFPPASGHNIFITLSIHHLVLWVFLFKVTLLTLYCWFTNINLITEQNLPNTCIFSESHIITAFLHLITLDYVWNKAQKWGQSHHKIASDRLPKRTCLQDKCWNRALLHSTSTANIYIR